jgi:peptidoglycan/LPS O-acetylase OafA/YrhL
MKSQTSGVGLKPSPLKSEKKKKIPVLHALLTIYGLLYLIFIIDTFISSDTYDPYNAENIIVNLAFFFFLIGYFMAWKNEGLAGLIFVLWWAVMWVLALFIVEHDKGGGVVMGLPLFILGILFIISRYRKTGKEKSASVAEPESKTPGEWTNR